MSLLYSRGPARIDANLTPLIDLAFLLIVFFVLVARMGGDQVPPVALPEPRHPATTPAGSRSRLAVNVMADGTGTIVSLGARKFARDEKGTNDLALAIAERIRLDPSIPVDIRADRSLRYELVEPALQAISRAASQVGSQRVTIRVCAIERDDLGREATDHE